MVYKEFKVHKEYVKERGNCKFIIFYMGLPLVTDVEIKISVEGTQIVSQIKTRQECHFLL